MSGNFIAAKSGIYQFYAQAGSYGKNYARLYFIVAGRGKSRAYRNEDQEHDIVSLASQFRVYY